MPIPFKKVFLIVLDGFGLAGPEPGNAILLAGMPYLNSLIADYPSLSLAASGLVVGLPWGQPGNSEVGHSAIGTGRIVIQDLAHINGEIRSGDFYKNPALLQATEHARKHNSAIHFIGCTSPGGIHSHIDHLIALLELAQRARISKVFLHFIADGQDMPAQDAINVLDTLNPHLKKAGAQVASIQGRSYAMDRVLNWPVTEKVWHSVVVGDAPAITDVATYLKESYAKGATDYNVEPATVVDSGGTPIGIVQDNDAIVFFDFRNDRVKQLATPFIFSEEFKDFNLIRTPKNVRIVTMTKYAENFNVPVAYLPPELPNTLGELIAKEGWSQWRIAEKEKEAHVTNFFNGGRILPFEHEERFIVSSRMMRGAQYNEHPEMSAEEIVHAVQERAADNSKLYVINFANPDMIGHAGNLAASIQAMKVIDGCLQELIALLVKNSDTAVIITADHGNAEELLDPLTKGEDTQHSTRPVPVIFIAQELKGKEHSGKSLEILAQESPLGTLVDIAPTILYLFALPVPQEMTGSQLIQV